MGKKIFSCHLLLHAGMLYFDLPFGLQKVDWDFDCPTVQQLQNLLGHFSSVDLSNDSVVVFCCRVDQVGVIQSAFKAQRTFSHFITEVFWVKQDFVTAGDSNTLAKTVEVFVTARRSDRSATTSSLRPMSPNPRGRANVIYGPQLRKLYKDAENRVVNQYEKPGYVIQWFIDRFCAPGSNVCVVGAGAGGDVMGALELGHNVVAVENDPRQVNCLAARFLAWSVRPEGVSDQNSPAPESGEGYTVSKQDPRQPPKACDTCGVNLSASEMGMGHWCACGLAICTVCGDPVPDTDPVRLECKQSCAIRAEGEANVVVEPANTESPPEALAIILPADLAKSGETGPSADATDS